MHRRVSRVRSRVSDGLLANTSRAETICRRADLAQGANIFGAWTWWNHLSSARPSSGEAVAQDMSELTGGHRLAPRNLGHVREWFAP